MSIFALFLIVSAALIVVAGVAILVYIEIDHKRRTAFLMQGRKKQTGEEEEARVVAVNVYKDGDVYRVSTTCCVVVVKPGLNSVIDHGIFTSKKSASDAARKLSKGAAPEVRWLT